MWSGITNDAGKNASLQDDPHNCAGAAGVMTQVGHNMEQHESVTYSSSEETVC